MDVISQVLQALGYLLLLVVLTVLWIKAARQPDLRRFWILLALAWTMNLFGNIAWIIHDLVTGTELDNFSLVDFFYVSHYVLIAAALWRYPASLPRRAWLWIGAAMLLVNAVVWAIYFGPLMALKNGLWTDFLGVAMYPVLDAGLIALAWLRYRAERRSTWNRVTLFLFCAMLSYGVANTINMTSYVFSLNAGGLPQNLFWILTDVFILTVAFSASGIQARAD
jgi:glucan phosphoethanolaminetransferase (alkaline phosphatase superfamily)